MRKEKIFVQNENPMLILILRNTRNYYVLFILWGFYQVQYKIENLS